MRAHAEPSWFSEDDRLIASRPGHVNVIGRRVPLGSIGCLFAKGSAVYHSGRRRKAPSADAELHEGIDVRWWHREEKLPAALRTTDPVHFLHIGKTGGTAIKAALKAYPPAVTLHVHPHRFALADVPRGERVFFFVRDPLSRFVSAFHSRKRRGLPR